MSLLKRRHIVIGLAAALAVWTPVALLGGGTDLAPASSSPITTPLQPASVIELSAALTQPIFAPDRLPPARTGDAAAIQAAANQPPPPPPAAVPTLVGVVVRGRSGVALVKGADGQTRNLATGQSVDGWTMVGLNAQQAVFALNGERQTVALDFSNRAVSSATPPPIPVPPPSGSVLQVPAGGARGAQPPIPLPPEAGR